MSEQTAKALQKDWQTSPRWVTRSAPARNWDWVMHLDPARILGSGAVIA